MELGPHVHVVGVKTRQYVILQRIGAARFVLLIRPQPPNGLTRKKRPVCVLGVVVALGVKVEVAHQAGVGRRLQGTWRDPPTRCGGEQTKEEPLPSLFHRQVRGYEPAMISSCFSRYGAWSKLSRWTVPKLTYTHTPKSQ